MLLEEIIGWRQTALTKRKGSDGTDPGVNMDSLEAALGSERHEGLSLVVSRL